MSWLACMSPECMMSCNMTDDPDEYDPFESLRLYARVHLNAPEEEVKATGKSVRSLTEKDFREVFTHVIERRGWPVRKYAEVPEKGDCNVPSTRVFSKHMLRGTHPYLEKLKICDHSSRDEPK